MSLKRDVIQQSLIANRTIATRISKELTSRGLCDRLHVLRMAMLGNCFDHSLKLYRQFSLYLDYHQSLIYCFPLSGTLRVRQKEVDQHLMSEGSELSSSMKIIILTALATLASCNPLYQRPLFTTAETRLISLSATHKEWMTEDQIFGLYREGTKFIDVTDGVYEGLGRFRQLGGVNGTRTLVILEFPVVMTHSNETDELIGRIDENRMEDFLTEFSSFQTRYFKSKTGQDSAQWLFDHLTKLSKKTVAGVHLKVTKVKHNFRQFSIVARLEVENADPATEIVILSAHQDSVNMWNPYYGRSPGADDDGSGSTTVMEAVTILVEAGFVPSGRVIEFHFYAAEEGGLLGSQQVVEKYVKQKIPVFAVLHSDMTGYQPDGLDPVVAINTDFVSKELTTTLTQISDTYSGLPSKTTKCGYACSDHASWTKAGVPSSFFFEATFENQVWLIYLLVESIHSL